MGAITCEETKNHVTSAALSTAPRYGRPVNWKHQVEMGMIIISTPMIWKRLMVKFASTPPGPTKGMAPTVRSGIY